MSDAKHCESCEKATAPVSEERAAELGARLHEGWERTANTRLYRFFAFKNFREAFGFATKVALAAEAEGHHPDFEVGWGRVALTLSTHSVGGLTENDFIMAGIIDRLL